jgi:hypothetical protein
MKYLFDSNGGHIANELDKQLYTDKGKHVGLFLIDYNIFVDLQGKYLAEIVYENHLLHNLDSLCKTFNFGNHIKCRDIGYLGTPCFQGRIIKKSNYIDVNLI